jgi:hypothetical protein
MPTMPGACPHQEGPKGVGLQGGRGSAALAVEGVGVELQQCRHPGMLHLPRWVMSHLGHARA